MLALVIKKAIKQHGVTSIRLDITIKKLHTIEDTCRPLSMANKEKWILRSYSGHKLILMRDWLFQGTYSYQVSTNSFPIYLLKFIPLTCY